MNRSYLELVVASEDELHKANKLAEKYRCRAMYVPQELTDIACMSRSFSKGRYKIYSMVDYPKGSNFGVDKFKHAGVSNFIVDGYDIILSMDAPIDKVTQEMKSIYSFIRNMIDEHVEICYTLSCSTRSDNDLSRISAALRNIPITKIKLETQTALQPTKANIQAHRNNIKIIREHTSTIIVICGNANYNMCDNMMPMFKVAVSPQQMEEIIKEDCGKNVTE